MITVTDSAQQKFLEFIKDEDEAGYAVRVAIGGRGSDGFVYDISLVKEDEKADDDEVVSLPEFKVFVDATSHKNLKGSTIDFVEDDIESGFKVDNPNPLWSDKRAEQIQQVLDEEINPGIASHGGYVSLLDLEGDTVYVKMGGGCQGCGMAGVTLKDGIETTIKREVPSITQVLDTTDHASGDNPYYQPSKGEEAGSSPLA
jgi:Fe/S biogenesis protein NfuA